MADHSPFVQKLIDLTDDPVVARKVHGWAALFWIVAAVPSALTGLKSSISYLVFLSVYAVVAGHWGGYQAAGAEIKADDSIDDGEA